MKLTGEKCTFWGIKDQHKTLRTFQLHNTVLLSLILGDQDRHNCITIRFSISPLNFLFGPLTYPQNQSFRAA